MRIWITLLAMSSVGIAFPALAEPVPVPDWYVRGVTAAILDPTPGVAHQALLFPRVSDALAAIGPAQRQTVLDTLVKLAANSDTNVQQSVADAFAAIKLDDAEQRKTVLGTLVTLAASRDRHVQRSVAAAFAAIKLDDAAQRHTVLDALVTLAASSNWQVQQSVAAAFAAIELDDAAQRQTVLDTLGTLAASGDSLVQRSVAAAFAAMAAIGPAQRQTVLDTLVTLAASSDWQVQQSVAAAFAAIKLNDAAQRQTVLATLVTLAASSDWQVQQSVAAAFAAIKLDDAAQRQTGLATLVTLAASRDWQVQRSVAAAFAVMAAIGPEQRKTVLDTLVKLAANSDTNVQRSVAAAFAAIKLDDAAQRQTVLATLGTLAASGDSLVQRSVAAAFAAMAAIGPAQRQTVLDTLVTLAASSDWQVQQSVAAAFAAIKLNDAAQRQTVLATLVTLAASSDWQVQQSVAAAFAAIKLDNAAQRQTVLDTLVKLAANSDTNVQQSVAAAFAAIKLDDAAQRQTVLATLGTLAASGDSLVQRSVAAAFAAMAAIGPAQRQTVLDTLVTLAASSDWQVQQSVTEALFIHGPLGVPQVARVLTSLHRDRMDETPRWRAFGWVSAGALPGRMPEAILLTFAGRPSAIPPEQRAKDPADGAAILRAFLAAWPQTEPASTLRAELASQTKATMRAACPAAGAPTDGLLGRAWLEWVRTRAWLASWFGAEDQTRCWRDGNRLVLQDLQQAFASEGLGDDANAVRDHLAADGAMPVIGEGVLGLLGWTMFWTGFIAAFPHSARVRAFYLFNEKARGALTLWFVPAIMTLLPVLRRRMLLPFRDDLLADARLDMLDEREWFARLYVQDRTRTTRPIAEAIPEIRGRTLLVGESGLGKTTFLRVLAKRSRRMLVFLNARSCEKGIEDAILQRVSSFQSAEFFRGLIYSGDLVVVVDGLNEVNADIRAGIVAFANRPGKPRLLIATQPIEAFGTERSPLTGVTSFELLPLPRAEIASFLKSRTVREDANMRVHGAEYDKAVDQLLADALDVPPGDHEIVLQEQAAALQLLSNPMDLTYASELIARGQIFRPSQIVEQAYTLARARYRLLQNRDFPVAHFAEGAVKLRRADRNWLTAEEFPAEQGILLEYKLLVSRQLKATAADKDDVTIQRFRHDKVMDVLMKPAFDGNDALQEELLDDPRFRGVYLLFAQAADREVGRKLRDLLGSRAAQTGDNGLSNEFVRRFDLAARSPKPRRRAA